MVDVRRAVASAVVGATGLAVAGIVLEHAVTETPPLSGLLLAGFGALVGAALAAGSVGVYRSSFTTTQTLRIGGGPRSASSSPAPPSACCTSTRRRSQPYRRRRCSPGPSSSA